MTVEGFARIRYICRTCLTEPHEGDQFCRICGASAEKSFAMIATPPPSSAAVKRVGSAWPRRLLTGGGVLLLLLTVSGFGLALVNYRRADTWHDRADQWQARSIAAEERARNLETDLTASREQAALLTIGLDAANADRAALQQRIDQLAGEKATAQDQQRVAEAERDSAVYVSNLASTAAVDGAQCLSDVGNALDAIVSFYSGAYVDSMVDRAVSSCGRFDSSYRRFANAVGGL